MGPLLNGLASHHAGLLPGWKGLVEGLFQQGTCLSCFQLSSCQTAGASLHYGAFTAHAAQSRQCRLPCTSVVHLLC